MRTSKKLIIGLAVLAVSITGMHGQLSDIQLFEFDTEKGIDVRRIGHEAVRGYSLKEIGWTSPPYLIDFTYRKTDRNRTGKYSHIVFPTTGLRIKEIVLTGNNLTNLTIPPMMKDLRKIVLDGNVNLKAIRLQQDTCAGSTLTIDFAGMERLRIESPRRLRSRIIVNGRNALELHPLVTVQDREDKLEIVEWPYLIREFHLDNRKESYKHDDSVYDIGRAGARIINTGDIGVHVGLCSPNGRQIQFTKFSELHDPWAPVRWEEYHTSYSFNLRIYQEQHHHKYVDGKIENNILNQTHRGWSGEEFFGFNFGEEKLPPLIQTNKVSFKVRYYHPVKISIYRVGHDHRYPERIGEWIEDEVVFRVVNPPNWSGGRLGGYLTKDDVVYRVKP